MFRRWSCAILTFTQALLIGWIGWRSCPDKTETAHMAAAVYFWQTFQFDVFSVNPPLTRIVSGLPVISCRPNYDWGCHSSRRRRPLRMGFGHGFHRREHSRENPMVLRDGAVVVDSLAVAQARTSGPCLTHETYGGPAGFVFLVLWCFSPLLLGWGGTICPDAAAAALGLAAVYAFRKWLHARTGQRTAIAGACLGLLPLTKLTWIVAFALWPILWCAWVVPIYLTVRGKRPLPVPPLRQLAAMLLLALYVLNMGYLFDGTFRPLGKYEFISQSLGGQRGPGRPPRARDAKSLCRHVARSDPGPVARRFRARYRHATVGLRAWHGFVPSRPLGEPRLVVLLPLRDAGEDAVGDVGSAVSGRGRAVWSRAKRIHLTERDEYVGDPPSPLVPLPRERGACRPHPKSLSRWARGGIRCLRDEMLILLPCAAVFLLVSSQTGFSKHPRYILPALPFFFVAISRVGVAFTRKSRVASARPQSSSRTPWRAVCRSTRTACPTSTSWPPSCRPRRTHHTRSRTTRVASIARLWPTIKNAVAAGPWNGPRHLLDSNVDWGQDLYYLEDWYVSHPEARPMKVAYFGGYPLDKTKIESAGVHRSDRTAGKLVLTPTRPHSARCPDGMR